MQSQLKYLPSINNLLEEYSSNHLLDSEDIYNIKTAIESLDPIDRTLFIVYCDTRSMRDTADILHVSVYYVWKNVNRIKELVIKQLSAKLDYMR